ncbi:MAG: tRNA 2-thiouridine(34) synthase MnmA [Oscillospiraceae bacterium]|nr:tRNA 2-thiouridine(34) synthase MnmA [Oscillospiraceae bacterium]
MKKALIAMSGGVDSAVAAYLTLRAGYQCTGVTMRLFDNQDIGLDNTKTCCSLRDVEDARSVAYALGMEYHVFNFTDDFRAQVIGRFIEAYQQARTPNPCIDCNRYMKFEKLLWRAKQLDIDCIVTGHYAQIERAGGRYLLKKAVDLSKDQSYVLYNMTQEQLAMTQFALGGLHKPEVREIAVKQGFTNAKKRESQDICFVPDGDYAAFIEQHTGKMYPCGDFIDSQGNVLGRHKGVIRYTIGQRKGLGLSFPQPMYVGSKDAAANTVTLCRNEELYARDVRAVEFNWIMPPVPNMCIKAKIRYAHTEQSATIVDVGDEIVHIRFDEPQRAVAAGQAIVLYDGDFVVGGGVIV